MEEGKREQGGGRGPVEVVAAGSRASGEGARNRGSRNACRHLADRRACGLAMSEERRWGTQGRLLGLGREPLVEQRWSFPRPRMMGGLKGVEERVLDA